MRSFLALAAILAFPSLVSAQVAQVRTPTEQREDDRRYAINWGKAKRELGYEPAYSFADYLAATVRWYVDHPAWWQRVKSGEYAQYYERQYGTGMKK